MITHDGARVFPPGHEHHTDALPTLDDIARGLSRQARFCGHTDVFYSVLVHSCVVASLLGPDDAFFGVLHDAHEAVMSDVPTPWKTQERQGHEDYLMGAIIEYFAQSLRVDLSKVNHAKVKRADFAALKAEAHVLGHAAAEEFWPKSGFEEIDVDATLLTGAMVSSNLSIDLITDPDAAGEMLNELVNELARRATSLPR